MPFRTIDKRKEAKAVRMIQIDAAGPSGILSAALSPLESIYSATVRKKISSLQGMEKVSLPAKVISIGNITLGGTGKTPVCIYLAKRFSQAGRKVGISTRGYGRKSGAPTVITKNTNIATWKEFGDEPLLFAASPHITAIAIERDKALGAALLVRDHSCDTVILDDGFQFVTLKRDYDIVLLDAAAPFGNGRLLPRGTLREPLSALSRADTFWLTRCDHATEKQLHETHTYLKSNHPYAALVESTHKPAGFRELRDKSGGSFAPFDSLRGQKAAAACAIAAPASFALEIEKASGQPCLAAWFTDHHPFTESELREVETEAKKEGCSVIVTTEKDEVRIPDGFAPGMRWLVMPVEIEVVKGIEVIEAMLSS